MNILSLKDNVLTLNLVSGLSLTASNYKPPKFVKLERINGHKCRNRNLHLDLINLWNILDFKEHHQREIKAFKINVPNSLGKSQIWVENIRRSINR